MSNPTPTNGSHADPTVPAAVARRTRMSIAELEASLPSPEEVARQAEDLRAASVSCINVDDVNEMMGAVMKKAKEGDTKSVKLILDHINSQRPQPEPRRPGPQPAASAPIQLKAVEPEPPRAVAIDSPDAEQKRLLLGMILMQHQPMLAGGLAKLAKIDPEQLDALLNHDWFKRDGAAVRLTPLGKNALG